MNESITEKKTLTSIILSNFDEFQRRESALNDTDERGCNSSSPRSYIHKAFSFDVRKVGSRTEADIRAMLIRKEISHFKRSNKLDQGNDADRRINENPKEDEGLAEMMNNLEINKASRETQDEILKALFHCINAAFVIAAQNIKSTEESIHSMLELAATFGCTFDPKNEYVFEGVLNHVAKFIKSQEDVIRAKACVFFGYCLSYLLSMKSSMIIFRESSLEKIFKVLNPRLLDKAQLVRLTATKACGAIALTNTNITLSALVSDHITQSLMDNTKFDTSFAVRVAALQSIPLNEDTLPFVVGRTRDVKEKVRIEALNVLMTRKGANVIQDLTLDNKLDVLRNGLSRRCKNTYEKTLQLLCTNWLKCVKFDPIEFLRMLDPCDPENESVCESVIRSILSIAWNEDEKVTTATLKDLSSPEIRAFRENVESIATSVSEDELDAAHALYLRVKCAMIEKSTQISEIQKHQQIQNIFVDVPTLCEVLISHIEKFTAYLKEKKDDLNDDESENTEENECFVCLQLLKLSRFTDLQEEGSRRHFFSIIRNILINIDTPDILLDSCLQIMIMSYDHETEFVKEIADILQEILANSTSDREKNSIEAHMIAASTEAKMRMGNMLSLVLEKVARTNTEDGNLNSFHSLIMPMVTSENTTIREAGVSCLGKFALLSTEMDVVEQFQSILLKLASNPREKDPVRAQAALSLCDLALLFQTEWSKDKPKSKIERDILNVITSMMDYEKDVMLIIAAEICVKLMIANKLHNAKILSELLMMHFDTNYFADSLCNDDDWVDDVSDVGSPTRLLQMLSVFFPAYSMTNVFARNTMIASLKPLLISVSIRIKEKKTSLSIINAKKLVGHVCSLVNTGAQSWSSKGDNKSQGTNLEDNLLSSAIVISETILENHFEFTKTFSRGLCVTLGGIIGSLEGAEVDGKLVDLLSENIDNLEGVVDDEKIIEEIEEMHEVIHSVTKTSNKEQNNDMNVDDTNIVESLNNVSLQDEFTDDRYSRDTGSFSDLSRSLRTSRQSSESVQSIHSVHSEMTTTRSSRKGIKDSSNLSPIANPIDSPRFDVENVNFLPGKFTLDSNKEIDENRCLAPLNQ